MNALAEYMQKFGLNESSSPTELKIGQSFFNDRSQFHTIRYDFIPESVDATKTSALDFGESKKVTVTMPNLEGGDTTESVYQGSRRPHMKECLLIINNETGELILEKLNTAMMVKKTRVRQEDLTGKSLALNRKIEQELQNNNNNRNNNHSGSLKFPSLVSSSNASSNAPSSSSTSSLQPKLLPNRPSPPFGGMTTNNHKINNQNTSSRNGFVLPTLSKGNSKTPSPPSMPTSFGGSSGQKGSSTSGSTFGSSSSTASAIALGLNSNKTGRLSEDSSSDSSDDENDSSLSDSSSSGDEDMPKKSSNDNVINNSLTTLSTNSQPSMPSMPLFLGKSMPSFLGKPKEVSPVSTSNHSIRSIHSSNSPGIKQGSTKALSLSEDSDSDMDTEHTDWKKNTKNSMPTNLLSNNSLPTTTTMPSMPSSFGFSQKPLTTTTSTPIVPPSMPSSITAKVDSVLSNDLQLSESSSDEDE